MTKNFTTKEINQLKGDDLQRFVVSYGDGQGDTYIKTLDEFDEDEFEYMDYINDLYKELGGNMVNIRWIENNRLVKIRITDWK